MFDVGFSELVVIGVVALVVFGPEDLPRVARTVGHLLGKFRRYVADVKSEIAQEMEAADLKRLYDDVQSSAQSLQSSVQDHAHALQAELQGSVEEVRQELTQTLEPAPAQEEGEAAKQISAPVEDASVPLVTQEGGPETDLPERDIHTLDLFAEPPATDEAAEAARSSAVEDKDDNQLDLFGMPVELAKPAKE
ncbi:Sec-independent protein translocase protein TatB [Uliginosibacterium gangwonense]|uniref:Sec-independent protein translocase protein TatB n=1 Tax=Uliginosibacterium gangwonense TaxID=392736 RepID=UPI000378DEEF|nr:Sec-independent protein translocase protein TatB [Uliginosibacterium gangwonense]